MYLTLRSLVLRFVLLLIGYKHLYSTLINNGGFAWLITSYYAWSWKHTVSIRKKKAPTLKPNFSKLDTCQGQHKKTKKKNTKKVYLGLPNSDTKPTFSNMCGLLFNNMAYQSECHTTLVNKCIVSACSHIPTSCKNVFDFGSHPSTRHFSISHSMMVSWVSGFQIATLDGHLI